MSQTTPPTITPLPTPPSTSSPSTFATLADAFMSALLTFASQVSAVATNVYNNAVDCYGNAVAAAASASTAATQAGAAASSASAAAASAAAPAWVSGATITQWAAVLSPLDMHIYRRITATGSGTADPKNDPTNYQIVPTFSYPYLHVREEQASGTDGGTSTNTTYHVRTLNTVVGSNTIPNASLASSIITLPAGTYDFLASAPAISANKHKLFLYNDSDSTDIIVGDSMYAPTSSNSAKCQGRFTLAATKNVKLRHYIQSGTATSGLGIATGSGAVEVFSSLQIWKVA